MHACGHDGHMAMLLVVAAELDRIIHTLPDSVLLIFQPAEETTGGALDMCKTGFMEKYNTRRVFGFHLWPTLPKRTVASRAGECMAQASDLDIIIEGRSAHCGSASEGIDALAAGCRMVEELYEMERTEFPESVHRLLKIGKFTSGDARNIISGRTVLEATIRCFDTGISERMFSRIYEIADNIAKDTGCKFSYHCTSGHYPLVNDPAAFEEVKKLLSADFDFQTLEKPFMQAEDFSAYLQHAPGVFLFLGTGTGIPLHANNFDFDESVLETGVKIYLKLLGA